MPLLTVGAGRALINAPSWTPALLPSLIGWYKADTGVTTSSGNVTSVVDQSGNGHTLINSGDVPFSATEFNGYPAFNFAAANNAALYRSPFGIGTGDQVTVMVAGRMNAATQSFGGAVAYGTSGSTDYASSGSGAFLARDGTIAGLTCFFENVGNDMGMAVGRNRRFGVVLRGDDLPTLRVRNIPDETVTTVGTGIDFTSAGTLVIGNRWTSGAIGSNTWDGPIAEVIICNTGLDDINLALLNAYLGIRYDLTAAWSPLDLPGLLGWYKADTGVTGSPVTAVADQSGNGYDLTNNGTVPFNATGFNGFPAFDFAAANAAALKTTAASVAMGTGTKGAVFAACQMKTNTANFGRLAASGSGGAGSQDFAAGINAAWLLRQGTSNGIHTYRGGAAEATSAISLATNYRLGAVFDGANLKHYINNVAGTAGANTDAFGTPAMFVIGNQWTGVSTVTGAAWDGPVAEVIFTNAAPSSGDRLELDAYFVTKYVL